MQRLIFHEHWWLDAVAPRRWDEITVERGGATVAALPYADLGRRLGMRVIGAPPLTPYLGPIVDAGNGKYVKALKRDRELQTELIEALPPHDVLKTTFPIGHRNWTAYTQRGFVAHPRVTYVLDGIDDLDRVWSGTNDTTRNIIRRGEKALTVRTEERAEHLIAAIASTFDRQSRTIPYDRDLVTRIVDAVLERDAGTVLSAHDREGAVRAAALFVRDADSTYYLAGGADTVGRRDGAQALLVWEGIKHAAAYTTRFDFEGSMLPGVEHFFRGFGGQQTTYLGVLHASRRGRIALAGRDLFAAARPRRTT